MAEPRTPEIRARLDSFGADLSRWPEGSAAGVREALLRDPELRRAYDRARGIDRLLAAEREALDAEILGGGAGARVAGMLARRRADLVAFLPWQRLAAALLVASFIGGAIGWALPPANGEPFDTAMVDPLYELDAADAR